jgi:RHS repeat-associated protein
MSAIRLRVAGVHIPSLNHASCEHSTHSQTDSYTYDAANRLTSLQAPNQALINYGYDNDDRLTSITQGSASIAFAYDHASRRISGTTPSGSWAYGYDAASELTSIGYTGYSGASLGTLTYGYGLDGSVTSRSGSLFTSVLPAAVTSAAYNAGNRLTSRVTSAGTQTPVWDANGSLTSDGVNSITWDARNRMTGIGSQASFVYDAFGRRISVTKNGQAAIGYIYSGDDVIQETQSGSVLAAMLTGLGIDERYVRAGELVFTDLLGSTVALSNGATIQTSYAYDPYGVTTSAGAATTNTYQFTGRENDGTTAGLMYYRARYYNPAWGRFVSEDPIGVAGGVNLYGYVQEQPTGWRDPSGLTAAGGLAGAGWGGWAGGAIGGLIDPVGGEIPGAIAGRIAGAVIGDWLSGPDNTYPSPNAAFRAAKRDAGIPMCQQPDSQGPNQDRNGKPQPGRQYEFGKTIIANDSAGHNYPDDPSQNRGPHFNIRGEDGHYGY